MEEDTSGFYAVLADGELYYGPNFVSGPGFDLNRDRPEDRERTDLAWRWFDSRELAITHYNWVQPVYEEEVWE